MIPNASVLCIVFACGFIHGIAGKSTFSRLFTELNVCECGIYDDFTGRIVGGNETLPNEYPWMAAIFNKKKLHCGGSLINDRYILTAGHCLHWVKRENVIVVLGLHDKKPIEKGYNEVHTIIPEIDKFIVHKDFMSDYLHDTFDLGLIRLKEPVKYTSRILPICLPTQDETFANRVSTVIGWGRTMENGESSRFLKGVNVTVISNADCEQIPKLKNHIVNSMLCAYNLRMDACQGDSGGPLLVHHPSGFMEQIGVVSWGIGCAQPGMPGIYTRVTSFLSWISLHTTDALYCKRPVL